MSDQGTMGQAANGDPGTQHQGHSGGGVGPNGGPPVSRFRQSQYAEAIANPLPELAVVAQPEPVSNLSQLECDDTASSTRAVVQPDNIGDPRGSAVVYAGEKPTLWRKYRAPVIIALIIAVIVLVGTVVGVVVSNANKDHSAGGSPSTSTTPTPTTGSSSVSMSSSTSATASSVRSTVTISVSVSSSASKTSSSTTSSLSVFPTPETSFPSSRASPGQSSHASSVPSECADSSDFITSVSFMGVKDAPGNGGWKTTYYGAAKNSKDCCTHCYNAVAEGCNAWAYMPSTGFSGTACAMITGWDTGDDKDSTCPSGHDATVYFTADSDDSSDVGAAGPCGVKEN